MGSSNDRVTDPAAVHRELREAIHDEVVAEIDDCMHRYKVRQYVLYALIFGAGILAAIWGQQQDSALGEAQLTNCARANAAYRTNRAQDEILRDLIVGVREDRVDEALTQGFRRLQHRINAPYPRELTERDYRGPRDCLRQIAQPPPK